MPSPSTTDAPFLLQSPTTSGTRLAPLESYPEVLLTPDEAAAGCRVFRLPPTVTELGYDVYAVARPVLPMGWALGMMPLLYTNATTTRAGRLLYRDEQDGTLHFGPARFIFTEDWPAVGYPAMPDKVTLQTEEVRELWHIIR